MSPDFSHVWRRQEWRRQPYVVRNAIPKTWRRQFDQSRFFGWTESTLSTIRLFIRPESETPATARSVLVRSPSESVEIYELCRNRGEPVTLLMNGVDRVDRTIDGLRKALGVPYGFRRDDVVATLSAPSSGIGYHAGHEDGFIVQLSGARRWRVWSSDHTPSSHRLALLSLKLEIPSALPPTSDEPILNCELNAGDVLYIPPFCPHDGYTLSESISLSVAWRGLSLGHLVGALSSSLPDTTAARLLPDRARRTALINAWIRYATEELHALGAKPRAQWLEARAGELFASANARAQGTS